MGRTKEQKFRLAVLEEACRVPRGSRALPCPLTGAFWKDLSSIRLRAFPLKNVWMSCQATRLSRPSRVSSRPKSSLNREELDLA